MTTADQQAKHVSSFFKALEWPTVLVFGADWEAKRPFVKIKRSNTFYERHLNDAEGEAFGAAGKVVELSEDRSQCLVLLDMPSLERFWQHDRQKQFREFATHVLRFHQRKVKLTAIVYCHVPTGKEADEQTLLKYLDIFDKILGPRIFCRLFAVEFLHSGPVTQNGTAGKVWAHRVADWKKLGACLHSIHLADSRPGYASLLPRLVRETGVQLELQSWLAEQSHSLDAAPSHFLDDIHQLQVPDEGGGRRTPEIESAVASPPRPTSSRRSQGARGVSPIASGASMPLLSSVTSLPYHRLGENKVRLVRLLGGPHTDAVSVNIFHADLDNPPAYEALSYVVGELAPIAELNLRLETGDITTLHITPHLENVLKTLRYTSKDRMLWIDALSIAQDDAEEKSGQILNMGRIFSNATNVCVWLGPATPENIEAMDFIPDILDFNKMKDSFASTKIVQSRWISLAKLMTVPYFSRRWIVQEIALAKKATVYCGSKTVEWFDFADAAVLLENHWTTLVAHLSREERDPLGDIHAPGAMSLVQLTSRSLRKDHDGRVQARLANLESLVTALPMFDTKLQHDAIYSIMSLARDTYQGKSLQVDYTLDPVELFANAITMIIKATGSLDITCRPWAPVVRSGKPSWIGKSQKYSFVKGKNGQYERRNADSLVGLPEKRTYNASGDTTCYRNFEYKLYNYIPPRRSLKVRGFALGVISKAYEKSQHGNIPDDWLRFRKPAYETTVSVADIWTSSGFPSDSSRLTRVREVLWRTLFADRTKDGQAAPRWYVRACHHCFSRPGEHWGEQDVNIEKLINGSPEKLSEVLVRIRETIWGRKLFQYCHTLPDEVPGQPLNSVRYAGPFSLGLGPSELYEGDLVVVLFGCSVPLILRKCQVSTGSKPNSFRLSGYELIGEAYVYGRMDGEALEKKDDGTYMREEKDFEIF